MNFAYFIKILSKKNISSILKLALSALAAFIIYSLNFDLLDLFIYDIQVKTRHSLQLNTNFVPKIALIEITPNTLKKFSGYPKASDHANILKRILPCESCELIYNLKKNNGQLSNFEGTRQQKLLFSNNAKNFNNLHFIFDDMELSGSGSTLSSKLSPPLQNLVLSSAPKTIDTKINPKSPVTRRIILDYQNQPLFHLEIARKYNSTLNNLKNINGLFQKSNTNQVYINFYPSSFFPKYDFADVYTGSIDKNIFNDKIIILGENTFNSIEDYSDSPFVNEGKDLISNSELHANMLQTLVDNSSPRKVSKEFNFLITLLLSVLTVYIALSVKPSRGIILLISTFFAFWVISLLLLSFFNIWIDMAHPLLTIFLCYYFFIPYRLIIENRRSWEYLQKNKLLQQVEELKSNFISMMSHDLKTPIARIQGMTEVILKDEVSLSHTQREAVDTIKGSSDELLKFINSILQYGRIESRGVDLNKQSKDINQLLKDVIKKHDFLAKVKRIKVEAELEPLFPISVDIELMKQVFSNLIENAIKYSLEDSIVVIKSRETDNKILVDIIDSGIGIPSEDLPNIFMKFYRSHNVKTSTIKGTGLGLYLAQYFVNLHKGHISVVSEPQKGSVFTVTLHLNS